MSSSKRVLFSIILIAFLASACGSLPSESITPATVTSAPTLTPNPSTVTPTSTPEFVPVTDIPTPLHTSVPPLILTPDAIQLERWREYQTELARVVLSSNPELGYDPVMHKDALCEWDILGQSGQEVYVYAVCAIAKGNGGMRKPAIIYLEPDGTIREVKLPEPKEADSSRFNYDPFPPNVQEKFCFYFDPFPSDLPRCPNSSMYSSPRLDVLYAHLEYRLTHPEESPLVILSAPTP